MAKLMKMLQPLDSEYVDRRFEGSKDEYFKALELSSTLYIGNLSFYTTDDQVYELFGKVGSVKNVIMGLDRNTKTPCGFCFVTYWTRKDALAAVKYLNGTKLDNRQLRVDIDYGFEEGRQFGRGRSGGQVRDEYRTDFDVDRGGYGKEVAKQLVATQLALWQEVQAGTMLGAGAAEGGAAVFFNQTQRSALGQQQQQQQQHVAGQAQDRDEAAGGGGGGVAGVNPRLRDRDDNADDDDADAAERRRKRRRMQEAAAAAGGGAGGVGEQEPPQEEAPAAAMMQDDDDDDGRGFD